MIRPFACLLVVILYIVCSYAAVDFIGTANFTESLSLSPVSLVCFFAPWCKSSKEFLPVYDEIALAVSNKYASSVQIFKADCIQEKDLYWKNNIESFPTIKGYIHGREILFKDDRDFGSVMNFIEYIQDFSLKNLDKFSGDFVAEYLKPLAPIVRLYSPDDERSDLHKRLNWVCKRNKIIHCGYSRSETTKLVVNRQFDEEDLIVELSDPEIYSDDNKLMDWIQLNIFPRVVEFTSANGDFIFSDIRPGFKNHMVLIANAKEPSTATAVAAMRTLASSYFGKCIFIFADSSSEDSYTKRVVEDLQTIAKTESVPTAVMVRSRQTKIEFFALDAGTDVNQGSLEHWLQQIGDNSVKPISVRSLGDN